MLPHHAISFDKHQSSAPNRRVLQKQLAGQMRSDRIRKANQQNPTDCICVLVNQIIFRSPPPSSLFLVLNFKTLKRFLYEFFI